MPDISYVWQSLGGLICEGGSGGRIILSGMSTVTVPLSGVHGGVDNGVSGDTLVIPT